MKKSNALASTVEGSATVGAMVTLSSEQMKETIEQLRLVREFIYHELRDNSDYGKVAGFGDKPTLLQPGAQKICMFFNVYPEFEVERKDLELGHVEYIVKTTLISRTTGLRVGSGVGSCSSMEKKYRYRNRQRSCPKCGAETIRASRSGGYFCAARAGGCGGNFPEGDTSILGQQLGLVENPDLADSFNTVLKIAKKRSFVDATLSLSCISEFFSQDLEDIGQVQPLEMPVVRAEQLPPGSVMHDSARAGTTIETFKVPAEYSLDWRDHEQVKLYNSHFEGMVDTSGTRNSDREPACRTFIKNHWLKITQLKQCEPRPDKIESGLFAECVGEWRSVVLKAMEHRATDTQAAAPTRKQRVRQAVDKAA